MGKIIKKILTYAVYILVPVLTVWYGLATMTIYDEKPETAVAYLLIGLLFDFLYSIALLIINRKSKVDRIINIVIAALLAPVILFLIIGVLASVL